MNREAYELANRIETELGTDGDCLGERLSDVEMKRYKDYVMEEIKKERQTEKKNFRGVYTAACAALILLAGTVVFGEDAHAMIKQISWSIGNALGISADLADYSEIVNTSVADNGYVVTLQEAVVSEEKLVVNYTLQREDGEAMDEILMADGALYINGKNVTDGVSGGAEFLDEEQKTVGVVLSYHVSGIDFSQENDFRLAYDGIGATDSVKGKWEFEFTADGADLIADTRRIEIGRAFELPDGVTVTLNELTANDLEQRISYGLSGVTDYIIMVEAVDSTGKQVEFDVRTQDREGGYMQNEEIIDDGRLDDSAEYVIMTLYMIKMPEGSGQVGNDYVQLGESFTINFS